MVGERREAELAVRVVKQVLDLPSRSQIEACTWQPLPVRWAKGLGMKVARRPCCSAIVLTMNLKKAWRSAVIRASSYSPVHLELAVGVLVVVLIGRPAELEHGVADRGDHLVAAHQGRLVVAGLVLGVARVGDRAAVGRDDEVFALDPGLHPPAVLGRGRDLALEDDAGRALDLLAVHPEIGREPADLGPPGQPGEALRIGHREHVRIGGRHVEPGGETREACADPLHLADRRGRHQLGAQHAEQIDEADQEVPDPLLLCDLCEIRRHPRVPPLGRIVVFFCPAPSRCRRAARRPSPPPRP